MMLEVLKAGTGIAALLISAASLFVALRAQRIALRQEERRRPLLALNLIACFSKNLPDGTRHYAFELSVRNPTDTNNSIADIELKIAYRKGSNKISLLIRPDPTGKEAFPNIASAGVVLPIAVDAHKTIAGWHFFKIDKEILAQGVIDDHEIIVVDTHGAAITYIPIVMPEYHDAPMAKKVDRNTT